MTRVSSHAECFVLSEVFTLEITTTTIRYLLYAFTVICLKQNMFLKNTVLQLFCIYCLSHILHNG
jgi:hypothetical protein